MGVPRGFCFQLTSTSEIQDLIIKSFSSINILFQNIFLCKVQIVEESLLYRMFYCLVCTFPLRATSCLSKGFRTQGNFGLQNPESSKFLLWNPKSQALEYGIYISRNPESHKRLESGIQVPLTKNQESNTWNPESIAWNPESQAVFDSFTFYNTSAFVKTTS